VHEQAEAEERAAEQEMIEDETAPLLTEVQRLRADIAALREQIAPGQASR